MFQGYVLLRYDSNVTISRHADAQYPSENVSDMDVYGGIRIHEVLSLRDISDYYFTHLVAAFCLHIPKKVRVIVFRWFCNTRPRLRLQGFSFLDRHQPANSIYAQLIYFYLEEFNQLAVT